MTVDSDAPPKIQRVQMMRDSRPPVVLGERGKHSCGYSGMWWVGDKHWCEWCWWKTTDGRTVESRLNQRRTRNLFDQ